MLISILGTRGTIPTSDSPTVCFLINNRLLFEPIPEIIQSYQQYGDYWREINKKRQIDVNNDIVQYPSPSIAKLEYIMISHLHWDHWGGLRHILHYISLIDRELRREKKLKIIIPHKSADFLVENLSKIFNVERSIFPESSAKILEFWLVAELGSIILELVEFIEISPNQNIAIDKELTLSCYYNKHLRGSVCYKLESVKNKLNMEKAKELNVPLDKTLSILQENKELMINGKLIKEEDIFYKEKVIISYSGDTPIDLDLINFLNNSNILIFDSTYLWRDPSYHLDSHSAFPEILDFLDKLNINAFIPVHFSYRYTNKEIKENIEEIIKKREKIGYDVFIPYVRSLYSWDKKLNKLIELSKK